MYNANDGEHCSEYKMLTTENEETIAGCYKYPLE